MTHHIFVFIFIITIYLSITRRRVAASDSSGRLASALERHTPPAGSSKLSSKSMALECVGMCETVLQWHCVGMQ